MQASAVAGAVAEAPVHTRLCQPAGLRVSVRVPAAAPTVCDVQSKLSGSDVAPPVSVPSFTAVQSRVGSPASSLVSSTVSPGSASAPFTTVPVVADTVATTVTVRGVPGATVAAVQSYSGPVVSVQVTPVPPVIEPKVRRRPARHG